MAYETKVLLMAMYEIVQKAESVEEIKRSLIKMANVEGVILDKDETKKKKKGVKSD